MGRKQEGNGIRAKLHSAGVQIKVLDQKGVIDLGSIQLWFGLLFGSFGFLYVLWQFFIVETDPMSHFPAHMRAEFQDQKHLYERFGDRQGIARTINIAMVVCDPTKVDAVFSTIKNIVLLSISPVHLLLFTQDEVMKKLIPDVEKFSWSVPGRLQFRFEFAQEEIFGYKESVPCEQQKLMLPSELQNHGLPAILVVGPEFLVTTNTDEIWRDEIIGLGEKQALGLFEDRHQLSTDVLAIDLIRSLTNDLNVTCKKEEPNERGPWHNWKVWKGMRDQKPQLESIQAELQQLRHCNQDIVKRISYEFENGKYGLRKVFNNRVFEALQHAFLKTDKDLSDKAFNDQAWEKLESLEPNNIDRNLLTDLLERIKDGFQTAINTQNEKIKRIEEEANFV
ncbi:Oidioi.mRNA.OKI2018_I69.chr2.g8146.t1.cds [Oikopleura dioica]|uniref:Oidioi.mRNA.OKI2018_I69.chr2.g8146.t1.cds n=1 Tax=Oikopleura dioica TaxID=34765 RepID=A0ABN7T8B6_OIKDI|nr:Oidioi.mRNA.OKI2018_I69.chr2.g8146.t1.cds [Oikopleura dioica]